MRETVDRDGGGVEGKPREAARAWLRLLQLTLLMGLLAGGVPGCAGDGGGDSLVEARAAVDRGDYASAQRQAAAAARQSGGTNGRALYLAGLAARQRGRLDEAGRFLTRAIERSEGQLAGDARAELGMVYSQQGRYARAARVLEQGSRDLVGSDRARALFFAGIARQKLGQWRQARRLLRFARSAARDATMRERIDRQLEVSGYTIQVGAFQERANAREAVGTWRSRADRAGLTGPRLARSQGERGEVLTLVQLGRFDTVAEASRAKSRLEADEAIVVPLAERSSGR